MAVSKRTQVPADEALLALPFDHYGRYSLTAALLPFFGVDRGPKVLDVGGHSSPLKRFYPDAEIVLTDIEPMGSLTAIEFRFDAYLQSSGAALPFRDGTFAVVTSHDTLEHVPPALRQAFLEELVRVASGFVVLTGPVGDPATVRAEKRLDQFVRNTLHWDQPFLREHLDLGLPTRGLIEEFFGARSLQFVRIGNGNLGRWLSLQALRHYFASLPDTDTLREALDRSYNNRYPVIDNGGPFYRQTYLVALADGGEAVLRSIAEAFPEHDEEDGTDDVEALEPALAALEQHADTMKDHLSALHGRIFAAEQDAFDARQSAAALAGVVAERDEELFQQRQTTEIQDAELARVRAFPPYRAAMWVRRMFRRAPGRN